MKNQIHPNWEELERPSLFANRVHANFSDPTNWAVYKPARGECLREIEVFLCESSNECVFNSRKSDNFNTSEITSTRGEAELDAAPLLARVGFGVELKLGAGITPDS